MEQRQLFSALTVYRERGAFLRRLEQFEKAKAAYDEALTNSPEDVRTLTGRSQACTDAMHPMQAYSDAELARQLSRENMTARNMQARALYTMSDFEHSYIMNERGLRLRRQPPYFQEGINQCKATLEDCVGRNAGHVLADFLPIIKHHEENKIYCPDDEPEKRLHVSRIPRAVKKQKLTQAEARKQLTLARVLAMKYLGHMAYDKFFLQNLTTDYRIPSANARSSYKLQQLINDALETLSGRQEMLRTQRPYYSVKLGEIAVSNYQNKFNENLLYRERHAGARTVEHLLRKIDRCLREKRIADLMSLAERLQMFLDNTTRRTLPDKDMYIERLYKLVGEGYLCQHRLSYTLSERGNRRRIGFLMGLPIGRPTSFDSVIAKYPFKFDDVKRATAKIEATLEMCENLTMKCWLQYELARLFCTQKNYSLAKYYAKRCQKNAEVLLNPVWWLNGCFVLISGDMQQANSNEVRIAVEEALVWVKKIQDSERVQAFLTKCAEIAAESVTADERKAVAHREKEILGILDAKSSVESSVLFKRIANVPWGRRFAVLPRDTATGRQAKWQSVRQRRRQHGLTIIPGREMALPAAPNSRTPGLQLFDL